MKSQQYRFINKEQITSLIAEDPNNLVIPDWHTYLVWSSLSDMYSGWCAITILPFQTPPHKLVINKLVKGSELDGLAWAENHLSNELHQGYQMDKSIPKDL